MRWFWLIVISVVGCNGHVENSEDEANSRQTGSEPRTAESDSEGISTVTPEVSDTPPSGFEGEPNSIEPSIPPSNIDYPLDINDPPAPHDAGPAIFSPDGGSAGDASFAETCPGSYPLPTLASWEPRGADPNVTVEQALTEVRATLVGQWRGTVTTAWMPEYPIHMAFTAEGGYASSCDIANACCIGLYWGSDQDSELKRFRVDAVQADGTFAGEIDMVWCYEPEGCYVGWAGRLTAVDYDASGSRLRFDLTNDNACCPVHVELERL